VNVLDEIRARASDRPHHPALITDARGGSPQELSYGELVRRFEEEGKRLRGQGVRSADRVGLLAPQGVPFVTAALAVLAADACLVPIPDDYAGEVLEELAELAHLHHRLRHGEELVSHPRAQVAPVDGQGDAAYRVLGPAYLRFTSGSTSARKGVILSHATIAERLAAANRGLHISPRDRILWLLPMAHHFVVSILLYLRFGATVLIPRSSLARDVLELAGLERATIFYASPYHHLLLAKDGSDLGLGSVRLAISTAEGLRAPIAESFHARFGLPLTQALGIIEVGLPVINLARAAQKPLALGRPLPDYQVWLRAEDGRPARDANGPERTGEICIRGPGLLDAYMEPWTPAGALLEPDGFRTGDQGYFDADGDLFLVGRRANRVSLAGMKFFSEEVEAILDAHPQVVRSRVTAREHAHLGEIPVAELVVRDPDHPPERRELLEHCRRRLPAYKIPREFRLVATLPQTATGKLARG
jgi:long-chain acyl-CoA synthetase